MHYRRWKNHGDVNTVLPNPVGKRHLVQRLCSVDGCDQGHDAKGFCSTHYSNWRKHGIPVLPKRTVDERFWAKVEKTDTCWFWSGALNQRGYGVFNRGDRTVLAHRMAYELLVGPISEPTLDHLCKNPRCVKPDHLEPVTLRENILRSDNISARCARKTHCPHGHPYDEANTLRTKRGRACRTCNAQRCRSRYQRLKGVA